MRILRRLVAMTLCAVTLGGAGSAALAQAPTPEADSVTAWLSGIELVYSASRYAQDAREAPVAVTIITAKEIREHGYRTLAEVIGAVRGFATRYDFNYDYATVGGLAQQGDFNTRVLFLVDGQRINGGATDFAGIGTEALVDVDLISHVEVIRGPGSALFGTNGFFGVVNIVTVGPRELSGVRVSAEAGSYGTYRGALAWGKRLNASADFLVAASAQQRSGQDQYYAAFDDPLTNDGVAEDLDDEETYRVLGKGRWGNWSLLGAFATRRRSVPTASYGTTFNDPRLETRDAAIHTALTYTHPFADLSRLIVSGGFNTSWYEGDYPYAPTMYFDYDSVSTWGVTAQYLREIGSGHMLTFGGEVRHSSGQIGVYDFTPPGPTTVYTDVDRGQWIQAGFAQVEWHLGSRVLLYTGLRYDHYEEVGGTANPRLGLVLRAAERTTLKALYGSAFRAPNIYELSYEDGGVTQKAPSSLDPERVRTAELSLEQGFNGLTASVSAFTTHTSDLIDLVTDPADSLLVFANRGTPESWGIETELRGRVGPVTGRASYTFQNAEDSNGDRPVASAQHLVRVGAAVPFASDHMNLAAEVRFVGEQPTFAGSDAAAYALTNLTLLARPFGPRTELMLSVKNLFDARQADPGGLEHTQNLLRQDGRSFRAGLRHTF